MKLLPLFLILTLTVNGQVLSGYLNLKNYKITRLPVDTTVFGSYSFQADEIFKDGKPIAKLDTIPAFLLTSWDDWSPSPVRVEQGYVVLKRNVPWTDMGSTYYKDELTGYLTGKKQPFKPNVRVWDYKLK